MNFDKYNPLKVEDKPQITIKSGAIDPGFPLQKVSKVEETTKLQSWKDSTPVIRLSEYLKKYKDQGIYLYQRDGKPYLYFDPGLDRNDMKSERWKIAQNTITLLIDAAHDLMFLIDNGLIDVPIRAGPSPASE